MEMNIDYHSLGQRIRKARKDKNVTQEELAEICALSSAHIGHIERGTRIPSLDTLFRISQALGVSMDYLIFDSLGNDTDAIASISKILDGVGESKKKNIITTLKALSEYDSD